MISKNFHQAAVLPSKEIFLRLFNFGLNPSRYIFLTLSILCFFMIVVIPSAAFSAERLIVKDSGGTNTFVVQDSGSLKMSGALGVGVEPTTGSPVKVIWETGVSDGLHFLGTFYRLPPGPGNGGVTFGYHADGTVPDYSFFYFPGGLDFSFNTYYGGIKNTLYAKASGEIGLGTSNPSHALELANGAYCNGFTWFDASSRDYNENIKDLTIKEAIATLKELNPVSYNYRKDKAEKEFLGFIAEDVPEVVASKDRKGMRSMDVVAVLTKVVQEQQKAIEELKKSITEMGKK